MKFLITNVYSWENKGDAAIVMAMIADVVTQLAPSEIALTSHDPRDSGKYGKYMVFPSFLYWVKGSIGADETITGRLKACFAYRWLMLRLFWFALLFKLSIKSYWMFSRQIAEKLRYYDQVEMVFACGGGYIQTSTKARKLESLLGFSELECVCLEFALAKIFGKPYILYNQSVGPFFNIKDEQVARKYLVDATVVICREELSLQRLRDMGLSNLLLRSDIAFSLSPKKTSVIEKYHFDSRNRNIGITVKKCLAGEKQTAYEKVIAEFIRACIDNDPLINFFFLPQVINSLYGDNDLEVADRICDELSDKVREKVHVITDDLHPGELKYIISLMHSFVGTRMHSNIFALASGVKTLALSYDLKTDGIMKMLDLSEYVIPVSKVSAAKMLSLFCKMQDDQRYKNVLQGEIKVLIENSSCDLKSFLPAHLR